MLVFVIFKKFGMKSEVDIIIEDFYYSVWKILEILDILVVELKVEVVIVYLESNSLKFEEFVNEKFLGELF